MDAAAVYFHPEGYDASGKFLMGRHSAGEGFLRGFLRHGQVDRFYLWNTEGKPVEDLDKLVQRIEPVKKPIEWISRGDRRALARPGAVHIPTPHLTTEAFARREFNPALYSITGVTHTTATERIMDSIGTLLTGAVEPWDAVICTSRAVRGMVETELEAIGDHLQARLGARSLPQPRLETIPLGVNAADFRPKPGAREEWRKRLGIPDEAICVLYMGRFHSMAKMNPIPMAMALERAAAATAHPLYWVVAGWGADEKLTERFHAETRKFCPSVTYLPVDGRPEDVRFSIWAAGDIFLSLSDNIQETFGLTPIEAMAAGLPCVVSDWDGYKDTVRDGVDGYRVPTYMPRPGFGRDLATRHALSWDRYELYTGLTSQFTTVDVGAAAERLAALANDAELRRTLGASARRRATEAFDWRVVIGQYQALWTELGKVRRAAQARQPPDQARHNPWRLDPFRLFANYPTDRLTSTTLISRAQGSSKAALDRLYETGIATLGPNFLPSRELTETILARLTSSPQLMVADLLSEFPGPKRAQLERGLLWLAKFDVLAIHARTVS